MMQNDKQLRGIRRKDAMEKRRLDQALNAKEFAVVAGISYSAARAWFRLSGFPLFCGVVFWSDFVQWRTIRRGVQEFSKRHPLPEQGGNVTIATRLGEPSLPPQAMRILREAAQSSSTR
jgi:hypothetical protein